MSAKSERRLRLEAALAADPADAFLRYGLAVQCLREGDADEGRHRLRALIAERPDEPDTVAVYQQLGQSYMESGEVDEARSLLTQGVARARQAGNAHAAAEMSGFLDLLG